MTVNVVICDRLKISIDDLNMFDINDSIAISYIIPCLDLLNITTDVFLKIFLISTKVILISKLNVKWSQLLICYYQSTFVDIVNSAIKMYMSTCGINRLIESIAWFKIWLETEFLFWVFSLFLLFLYFEFVN